MIVVHKESPPYIIISNQNTMTAAAFQSKIPMYVCDLCAKFSLIFPKNIYKKRLHHSRIWIKKKRHCNDLHLFCVIHTIQVQQIIQIVTVRAHNSADGF